MLPDRTFIPHTAGANGDLYAEVVRTGHTPLEGGAGGTRAEHPYATLNEHLHHPPENVYGMASATRRKDLAVVFGGTQGSRLRTPSPDYEQVDLPGDTQRCGRPPAGHPLPQLPPASPDHDAIYSTPEPPGPVSDKTPPPLPAKPSKPGVYVELEPQAQTSRTPPPLPAKPPKSGAQGELQPPVRPRTPPTPPPQDLKPSRTPGAAVPPAAVGNQKHAQFQSVNSELAAFLAKRRIE